MNMNKSAMFLFQAMFFKLFSNNPKTLLTGWRTEFSVNIVISVSSFKKGFFFLPLMRMKSMNKLELSYTVENILYGIWFAQFCFT